jgi:hypothetical protein
MLFQYNITFKPEAKNAILKRSIEKGVPSPPGMKILNMWSSVNGLKVTMFAEVENPAAMMTFADAMDDLCFIESYPVMPTMDTIKIHKAQK